METLEVSAKQFRAKQGSFFDMADRGRQIVITRGVRGMKQSYMLTPVEEEDDDFVVTPELLARIERAEQQMREGKVTVCKTWEDNLKFFDSL